MAPAPLLGDSPRPGTPQPAGPAPPSRGCTQTRTTPSLQTSPPPPRWPPSLAGCQQPAKHPVGSASPPSSSLPPLHPSGGPPAPVPSTVPLRLPGWATGEGALASADLLSSCSEGIARPRIEESGTLPGRFLGAKPPGEGWRQPVRMLPVRRGSPGPGSCHLLCPAAQGTVTGGQKDNVSCGGVGTCRRGHGEHRRGACRWGSARPAGAGRSGQRWGPPHAVTRRR